MQGEDPGLPDDAQVCFVQLKGPFHVQVDQAPGTRASTDPIATEVGVVFDAHTGNLLEWGILDSLPGSSPSQEKPSAQSPAPSISYSCSPNRCWGVNYWPNPVNGAYSLLNWPYPDVTRFYYGTGTAFVQNTIWLVDETEPNNCYADPRDLPSDCWVEAGLRAYEENGSNVTGLFWADLRPGYNYADHYGPLVNTLNSTWGIEIQIFKAGTVPAAGWCPTASYTWCVDLYSEGDGQELTAISGAGHTNRMKVSGYREGLELLGLSGAVANPMQFDVNQWESTSDNSWNFQDNVGTIGKYTSNPPVEDYWDVEPQFSNSGGTWVTCITGAGC
jgi:hypothetical protein